MIKEFFKTIGGLGIYLAALFLPFFLIVYYCYLNFVAPLEKSEQKKLFLVKDGQTISEIAESLESAKIIKNSWSISFITNFRMSEEESSQLKISSGEYALSPAMKPKEILQVLLSGKVVTYELILF
jgi:cell division protein YceG involved in septum cleavage